VLQCIAVPLEEAGRCVHVDIQTVCLVLQRVAACCSVLQCIAVPLEEAGRCVQSGMSTEIPATLCTNPFKEDESVSLV